MRPEAGEAEYRDGQGDRAPRGLSSSCAEGYRMWKVDYPKLLNIATEDLGFEVVHLIEFADEALKKGALKLTKPVDMRMTYHDSCSMSRLCDPWTPWKGKRGWMGTVEPEAEEAPRNGAALRPVPEHPQGDPRGSVWSR